MSTSVVASGWPQAWRLARALRSAVPALLFGVRLWAAVCLALYVAFWLQLDNAYWAGASAAVVSQPHLGASLRKGWYRMIGTVVGALAIVALTACFPQNRTPFLVGLALWGAGCAIVATLLRNFAAYSAALAGYTAAIIASDELTATGGPNGDAFMLAITRASEICIGIVCAGIVLGATDFGGGRRRLAALFADLTAAITSGFVSELSNREYEDGQSARRELTRRVAALDPLVDEAFGESPQLRAHSSVLRTAIDGLFKALVGWRSTAVLLARLPEAMARREASVVLRCLPRELRSVAEVGQATCWMTDAIGLHWFCRGGVRSVLARSAGTPSLRYVVDQTARSLGGVSLALNGLALLVGDPARPVSRGNWVRLHVPDWLPPLVNGGRAFVMIGAAELFWIASAWPNGAAATTWVAIGVILFAPRADRAYASASSFALGAVLAGAFAVIFAFAILPRLQTFAEFCVVIGLYLIPTGTMMARPWQTVMFTAMTANFVPILAPTNQANYDAVQIFNAGLAIVAGGSAVAISFCLMPPMSPAFRTRRLLMLTLRDLRRLVKRAIPRTPQNWESRIYSRLMALPDEASPWQRAQLLAALSLGADITRLRRIGRRLGLGADLDRALEAFARGDGRITLACLGRLDQALGCRLDVTRSVLRARGLVQAISGTLDQHDAYFDAGRQG